MFGIYLIDATSSFYMLPKKFDILMINDDK